MSATRVLRRSRLLFFKPDQTLALERAKRMPESRAVQYQVVGELIERRQTLVAIDNLGEDGKLR